MHDIVMVGHFPEDPELIRGGVEASVYGLATTLREQPDIASMTVVAMARKNPARRGGQLVDRVRVIYLTAPMRYLASSVARLPGVMRLLKSLPHPCFHLHGTALFQAGMALWLRATGREFVWTLHGVTRKETLEQLRRNPSASRLIRHLFFGALERVLERLASSIIVDTPYVTTELKRRRKVFVVPQGIFTDELSTAAPPSRDPRLIVSVGVFGPRKGHHHLLQAFAAARKRCPEARLAIAGSSTDRAYYDGLVARADALGCIGAVAFHPNIRRTALIELIHRASVFALHSQEESQGIAICEALYTGLPVVATRVGGIPDVVQDGRTGLLTDYGDVPAFAEALAQLLLDADLRARMSIAATAAGRFYDWRNIARKVAAIYRGQIYQDPAEDATLFGHDRHTTASEGTQ